jgi:hypothetical protein
MHIESGRCIDITLRSAPTDSVQFRIPVVYTHQHTTAHRSTISLHIASTLPHVWLDTWLSMRCRRLFDANLKVPLTSSYT